MLAMVLAVFVAVSPSPLPKPLPTAAPINLPLPIHSCPFLVGASGLQGRVIDTEALGHLYATALRAQGVGDHSPVTSAQLVQAFSDFMGCFVQPSPAPTPVRKP